MLVPRLVFKQAHPPTVVVVLPRNAAAQAVIEGIVRRKHRIVLVHGDDTIRVTLQVILKAEGYVVMAAGNATSALELIREDPPALVITEMKLPRSSGGDFIRLIRSDAGTVAVRVLAIGDASSADDAARAGADVFHTAPIAPAQLVKLVNQLIGRA